jgi:hypothetical protein
VSGLCKHIGVALKKLALKRLTKSDLTIFEWHFRNRNAGNQKSINLNADVFVDELYPGVPTLALTNGNEMPISVGIFGPGLKPELPLARKIIKGATYKNWRLNGEFIFNPEGDPNRFNVLLPGDLAVLEFAGEPHPMSLRMFLLASSLSCDADILSRLNHILGECSMAVLSKRALTSALDSIELAADHPLNELLLDTSLEDAALGGYRGIRDLLKRSSGSKLTQHELVRAREDADRTGELGAGLVFGYLQAQIIVGALAAVDWQSKVNAILPYDFVAFLPSSERLKIKVRSTRGPFRLPLHISLSEFREAADSSEPYCIYRVYGLDENGGYLRINADFRTFANEIIDGLDRLPDSVNPDTLSVDPEELAFGRAIRIEFSAIDEPM